MSTARCNLCPPDADPLQADDDLTLMYAIDDHIRLIHPDRLCDGPCPPGCPCPRPERWPDSALVVNASAVATPEDITGGHR